MPIHHRAPIIIAQGISKLFPYAKRAKVFEDKVWKGLYPHKGSRYVVRGSLVAGDIAGTLYRDSIDGTDYAPNVSTPYKQDQTRHRRGRWSSYSNSKRHKRCRCRRQSRSSYTKSSSNRRRR